MKKTITLCAMLLLLAFGAQNAAAQKFSWGVVGGLNLSKVKFTGADYKENFSSDNRAGWYFGPKVAFNTVLGIGVDAALEYSQRKLNVTSKLENESESKTYRTLEIPINVRYNIGLGSKLGVYVATGPQFGFALGNMNWNKVGTGTNFSKSNMNTTWNIGAGVRLLSHLEVGLGYNFALGKVGKAVLPTSMVGASEDSEVKYKTNTFQVQVAYMF